MIRYEKLSCRAAEIFHVEVLMQELLSPRRFLFQTYATAHMSVSLCPILRKRGGYPQCPREGLRLFKGAFGGDYQIVTALTRVRHCEFPDVCTVDDNDDSNRKVFDGFGPMFFRFENDIILIRCLPASLLPKYLPNRKEIFFLV